MRKNAIKRYWFGKNIQTSVGPIYSKTLPRYLGAKYTFHLKTCLDRNSQEPSCFQYFCAIFMYDIKAVEGLGTI